MDCTGAIPISSVLPIYSIGYGTRSLEELLALLQRYQIEYVLDVRTSPYSKFKPEFSKDPLQTALQAKGIHYVFMGDTLGGQPKDPSCYSGGKVDYDKLRATASFQQGLERLRDAFAKGLRVTMLCSEGRPEDCHRTKLIGESLSALQIPVQHIDEAGALRSQLEVIDRLTGGQLDLFGQPSFRSRKRYQPADPAPGANPGAE